jgi:glycosyltransferase involved in cell wall biosynthesis
VRLRDQPHIVSISPYVTERLHGSRPKSSTTSRTGSPQSFFDRARDERHGTVFYAGVIGRRKNALALVEAFARAASNGVASELRIIGPDGEPDYAHAACERIAALGPRDRVQFLGNFDAASRGVGNSPRRVSRARLVGRMRVAVLASNRCGLTYMIRDGETGFLVDPIQIADVAWRLRQLLRNAATLADGQGIDGMQGSGRSRSLRFLNGADWPFLAGQSAGKGTSCAVVDPRCSAEGASRRPAAA